MREHDKDSFWFQVARDASNDPQSAKDEVPPFDTLTEANQQMLVRFCITIVKHAALHGRKPPPLKCTKPPVGWSCSRPGGHEGPCAASPDQEPA